MVTPPRTVRILLAPNTWRNPTEAVEDLALALGFEWDETRGLWAVDDWCSMRVAGDTVFSRAGVTVTVEFWWAACELPPDRWDWTEPWITVLDWDVDRGEVAA